VSSEDYPDWSQEEIDAFNAANSALERAVHPDETPEQTANRIFKENLPAAARSIVTLAVNGGSERIKLDASKYVVERIMGRIGEAPDQPEDGPLADLFNVVLKEEVEHGAQG